MKNGSAFSEFSLFKTVITIRIEHRDHSRFIGWKIEHCTLEFEYSKQGTALRDLENLYCSISGLIGKSQLGHPW